MTEKAPYIYEFENFRLDPRRKSLWHHDQLVSLTPKAFETLLVLVRNSGEVVEKSELLDAVWADTFVEESTLSQNILTLRKTLASFESGKKFIATVPRRGYRFVAPLQKLNGSLGFSNGIGRTVPTAILEQVSDPQTNVTARTASKPERDNKNQTLFAAAALGVLLVGAAVLAWSLSRPLSFVDAKFREIRTTSILSDSNIRSAAISPDGKFLSLIETSGDAQRVLIRHVNETDPIEVVPRTIGRIIGASFSPDSHYIFYAVYRDSAGGGRIGELYRVSSLGGPAQLVIRDIDSPVSLSKSEKMSFVRRRPDQGSTELVIADLEGKNERIVSSRKLDEAFLNAAISPDGRSVVSAVRSKADLRRPMELLLIDVESGSQRSLAVQPWLWIGQAAWLADGSGVAVVGYGAMSPDLTDEVWFVSVPDGKARLLEAGVNGVFGISVTEDGSSIVAVRSDKITSFLVAPVDDLSKEQAIVTKAGDQSLLPLGADWATDGRIFYSTTENGNADIWSVRTDGSDKKRLTADRFADLQPRVSGDGKYLYFLSNRSGQMSVWRSKTDGTEAEKLTDGSDVFSVTASSDGRSIYYTARADSIFSQHLWRADPDGRNQVRITNRTTLQPRLSPDGKKIACYYPAPEGGQPVLTILNAENGDVIRQFPDRKNDLMHEWLKNSSELFALSRDGSGSAIWRISVDSVDAKLVRDLPNENMFRLAISPEGRRLFYEKGVSVNNVLLLNSAK